MKAKQFNFWRWVPVIASIALLLLIAVISAVTISNLQEATYWRKHTIDVILEAQTEEDDLLHSKSAVERYVTTGNHSLLIEFQNETNAGLKEFNRLTEITKDNPDQQKRLKDLDIAIKALFAYDDRVVGVYARQGAEAAQQLDESVESHNLLDAAINDLEKFKEEEKQLLEKRDAREQKDYHNAARLLVISSVAVAVLLVLANYFASREMAKRRRAEARQRELIEELQQSLAEVKTLSGLIPICGWCKRVRSDTGFWESVEHYVRAKTDATFTHGMCPNCSDKWATDVAKAAGAMPKSL